MYDNDGHQDDARAIPVGNCAKQPTWPEAYRAFRSNPREGRFALIMAKLCTLFFGINVFDEVIPLLGQVDDPLAPIQVFGIFVLGGYTAWRVSRYHNPRK